MAEKILVIGACGQVGTELLENLQNIYGAANVVAFLSQIIRCFKMEVLRC